MVRRSVILSILFVGVLVRPCRATVSATGFIPLQDRHLYHNQESLSVTYTIKNAGNEDIEKIKIMIPSGFIYNNIDSTSTFPATGKNWTYSYGNNIVTLSAISVSSAISTGQSLTVKINVATEEGFHPAAAWSGIATSTAPNAVEITEKEANSMEVAIIVLSLTGPVNDPVLIPGSTVTITCLLLDDYAQPLGDETLYFSIHSGEGVILTSTYPQTGTINPDKGEATIDFHVPSTAPVGISRIKCMYEVHPGVEKSIYVDVQIKDDPAPISFERLAFEQDGVMYIKEITPIKIEARYSDWSVRYKIDGNPWEGYVSSDTFTISGIGEHAIYFQQRDDGHGDGKEGTIYDKKVYVTSGELAKNKLINYPNPFQAGRGQTALEYFLEEDSRVTLEIFDLFGQLVWRREIAPGLEGAKGNTLNQIIWYGRNSAGRVVANGGYLCRLTIDNGGARRCLKRKIGVFK